MKILVAEDHDANRAVLKETLEKLKHEVVACRDGIEAYHHLCSDALFDAIISDYNMPGMTGLDLLRTVQVLDHRRGKVRFVLMSGDLPFRVQEEAMGHEARVLLKPWARAELLDALSRVSGVRQSER